MTGDINLEQDSSYRELEQSYNLLTEEIQFLRNSERTESLEPQQQFRLKKQIEAAEEKRSQVSAQLKQKESESLASGAGSQDLYNALRRLGYLYQIRLFRKLVEADSVGAFLIHGYPEYGQSWLLNRLVTQYVPHFLSGKVIRVRASRRIRKNDVSALWREVAGNVGLRGKPFTPTEVAQQVGKCLQSQDVLLIFHAVNQMPEETLLALFETFWLPLVAQAKAAANAKTASGEPFKLLMFLVDYEGCVESWSIPFAEELTTRLDPTTLIKSPMINEFSGKELLEWIDREYDNLPTVLTSGADDVVQAILEGSEDGIPELVLDMICDRCGHNWYEESEKWLTL